MIKFLLPILVLGWIFFTTPDFRVPVSVTIAALIVLVALFNLRDRYVVLPRLRREGVMPEEGKATMADVERLEKSGKTNLAIMVYRSLIGVGLKEAKEAVSKMAKD